MPFARPCVGAWNGSKPRSATWNWWTAPEPDEEGFETTLDDGEDDRNAAVAYVRNRTAEDLQWECLQLRGMLRTLDDLSGPSSKMNELLRTLDQRRIRDTGRFRQAVILTRFYDTLSDLVSRLRRVAPGALMGTYSGRGGQYWDPATSRMVGVDRDEIKHRFMRGEIDLLVCTDAAAEGLNLQSADLLINFDLPWNPMKVEQRIGRIDRIGQQHRDIYVLNLCYADSAEEIVYGRLLTRLAEVVTIVGTQQMSLLPVTPEEFLDLANDDSQRRNARAPGFGADTVSTAAFGQYGNGATGAVPDLCTVNSAGAADPRSSRCGGYLADVV